MYVDLEAKYMELLDDPAFDGVSANAAGSAPGFKVNAKRKAKKVSTFLSISTSLFIYFKAQHAV